jgi:hypothetical protein
MRPRIKPKRSSVARAPVRDMSVTFKLPIETVKLIAVWCDYYECTSTEVVQCWIAHGLGALNAEDEDENEDENGVIVAWL